MTKALLSLGSNLGDRLAYLRSAVAGLGKTVVSVSKIYETPPWPPGHNAPTYLNAAVLISDKNVDAYGWLRKAQELERRAGRVRDPARQFAPRTLDVDVIMVWDDADKAVVSDDPEVILPHPRAHLRAFVLKPWHDIQPDGQLSGYGPIEKLLEEEAIAKDLSKIRTISTAL